MNKKEAAIISLYTGILIGNFSEMHKYAEQLLQRPIFTHELIDENLWAKLKELAKPDLLAINDNLTDD